MSHTAVNRQGLRERNYRRDRGQGTGDSARLLRETAGLTADPESDEIIENVSYGPVLPELRRASGRPATRIGIEFKISH